MADIMNRFQNNEIKKSSTGMTKKQGNNSL